MKQRSAWNIVLLIMKVLILTLLLMAGCSNQKETAPEPELPAVQRDGDEDKAMSVNLTIDNHTFQVTLEDNETARAFLKLLPLTLNMEDVNGNEKYTVLKERIRKEPPQSPGTILAGDLMCYGDAGLVLFYETFSTSYTYVKIGQVEDVEEYLAVLGSGGVQVTITSD